MNTGRYFAACAHPLGAYILANDDVVAGPMSLDEAWKEPVSEPSLLIYTTERPRGQ